MLFPIALRASALARPMWSWMCTFKLERVSAWKAKCLIPIYIPLFTRNFSWSYVAALAHICYNLPMNRDELIKLTENAVAAHKSGDFTPAPKNFRLMLSSAEFEEKYIEPCIQELRKRRSKKIN